MKFANQIKADTIVDRDRWIREFFKTAAAISGSTKFSTAMFRTS
jgi:hypothetical protein